MRFFCVVFLLLASACTFTHRPAPTHHLPVGTDLQLAMSLPGESWQLSAEAPPFLAQRMIDHIRQELSDAGHSLDEQYILRLAHQRLALNEGFVANEKSQACLMIDFSPLRANETGPDLNDLYRSAYGALLALENEAGISDLESDISKVPISGGHKAWRIEADYLLDGQPHLFIGIIGYRAPYRFYFYYNDFLRNAQDRTDMEQILSSMQLQTVSGPGK